jgi:hypothetical protein
LLTGEGFREGDGRGAKKYDRKKAWFSINHLKLSDMGRTKKETFISFLVGIQFSDSGSERAAWK